MKEICTAMLLLLLLACSKHDGMTERLEHIRHLSDNDAQQAQRALDSLDVADVEGSVYLRMKYDLLRTRIADKLYVCATTDTVVKPVVAYFDENGTEAERQEAHYYAGSVYRDMHDTPKALLHFLQSTECAGLAECDSLLLRNAYSQLYLLYYRVQNYTPALEAAHKECGVARQIGLLDALSLLHVAVAYEHLDSLEEAIVYRNHALELAAKTREAGDADALTDLLFYYSMHREMDKADLALALLHKQNTDGMTAAYSIGLAAYYEAKGLADSAIHCHDLVLSYDENLANRYDAAKALLRLHKAQGNTGEALRYAERFALLCDSLNLGAEREMARMAQNEYRYHRDAKTELELSQHNARLKQFITVVVAASIALTLMLLCFILYRRHKHLRQLMESQTALQKVQTSLRNIDIELKETEKSLLERTNQVKQMMQIIHTKELSANADDIMALVTDAAKGHGTLTETDWKRLFATLDEMYPLYIRTYAMREPKVTDDKLKVAYLMKMGMKNPQIHNATDIPHVTLWRWTKKISSLMSDQLLEINKKENT